MKGNVPTGGNWKNVLLEIYRFAPGNYGESHKVNFWDDQHTLAKKFGINGQELGLAIAFLEDNKLIEKQGTSGIGLDSEQINPNWSRSVILTEKGFNVVIELEKQKREGMMLDVQKKQAYFSRLLMLATIILALGTVLNIIVKTIDIDWSKPILYLGNLVWFLAGGYIILFAVMMGFLWVILMEFKLN